MILKFTSFQKKEKGEKNSKAIIRVFDNITDIHYCHVFKTRQELQVMCDKEDHVKMIVCDFSLDKEYYSKKERHYICITINRLINGHTDCFCIYSETPVYACNDNGQTIEKYKPYIKY
jgi:hypothetical protein